MSEIGSSYSTSRPSCSYASNASALGSRSNRRGGIAVPPRHVRHLGHDVPRAVAPRSGAAQWRRRCPAPAAERATNFTEQACEASEQRSAASGLETGHRGRAATHVAPSAEEMHALTRCNRSRSQLLKI